VRCPEADKTWLKENVNGKNKSQQKIVVLASQVTHFPYGFREKKTNFTAVN
jgi:hypothetical protein